MRLTTEPKFHGGKAGKRENSLSPKQRDTKQLRWRILAGANALSDEQFLRYEELVYLLQMPFHQVRRIISALREDGLMSEERLQSDRRRIAIRITQAGRQALRSGTYFLVRRQGGR